MATLNGGISFAVWLQPTDMKVIKLGRSEIFVDERCEITKPSEKYRRTKLFRSFGRNENNLLLSS
jgi:hypothetical protein